MPSEIDPQESHRSSNTLNLDEPDQRAARMRDTVDGWLDKLTGDIEAARASERFQEWLDAQSVFHDYSYRNSLLIKRQCPEATYVAGYRTWQEEFDRHVKEGASAIWIWAPLTAPACPDCGNSPSYRDHEDCEYDQPQAEWTTDVVGFRPVAVFDVSQTDGEPLPALDTATEGGDTELLEHVVDAGERLGATVELVPDSVWDHSDADGVCIHPDDPDARPKVAVKRRSAPGAMTGTLLHEYAHAELHDGALDPKERAAREVEAEAVAALAGQRLGLDTSGSAFYLAAWQDDATETIRERLGRIQRTAREILDAIEKTGVTLDPAPEGP